MKYLLVSLFSIGILTATACAQTGSVTIPLGSVTLQVAPPPPAPVTITATITVTVNGVAEQAVVTLTGNISAVAGSSNQYQLSLMPPAAPVPLTISGSHVNLPELQPWLFVSGFADMAGNKMPATVRAGDRFMIQGHNFGSPLPGSRIEVNTGQATIISWLDDLIVAQAPLSLSSPSQTRATVLVWRSPQEYYQSTASFAVAASTP